MSPDQKITTNQVAEILNVSHSYVIKLIDDRKIAAHKLGKQFWVNREDVMDYQNATQEYQNKALDELAQLDTELMLDL